MIKTQYMENLRRQKNLTKYRMCILLKMSRQSYYEILRKRTTTLKTLGKIAKILEVHPRDLIN